MSYHRPTQVGSNAPLPNFKSVSLRSSKIHIEFQCQIGIWQETKWPVKLHLVPSIVKLTSQERNPSNGNSEVNFQRSLHCQRTVLKPVVKLKPLQNVKVNKTNRSCNKTPGICVCSLWTQSLQTQLPQYPRRKRLHAQGPHPPTQHIAPYRLTGTPYEARSSWKDSVV